ncbi:MAG: hypothetical protein Q9211_002628 [Gyalolechia sp. 1 TL-2023]
MSYISTPYAGGYPYPAYDDECDCCYDDYRPQRNRDNRPRRDRVYNLHPFPTNGRPLGPVHRAAQAEGIVLRHVQGCHRNGPCETAHKRNLSRELLRRGAGGQHLTIRQALRVVRGFPAGNPDRIPLSNAGEQAPGQQQLNAAPAGAAWGGNAWAGQSNQGHIGGGQANGMMGGGGYAAGPLGGIGGPRGGMGGRGGYGRGGGMGGMSRGGGWGGMGRGAGMGSMGGYEGAGMEMVHYEGPAGGYGEMFFADEGDHHGDGY